MQFLHSFLVLLLLLSSFLVFSSSNPVHSVLFLILTFCEASSILFLFKVDFIGLLFIIIYVGAIAVLFLFVVMMLHVKIYNVQSLSYFSLFLLFSSIFIFQLGLTLNRLFYNFEIFSFIGSFNYLENLDALSSIDVFGQVLYNYFLPCFLLAGLALLVAMIGAIVLTLNFSSQRKNEFVSKQLSRSDNVLSYFL